MKKQAYLFIGIFFLFIGTLFSQDFQGIAIYQTKQVVNLTMDSTKTDFSQQQAIQEMLQKQFEKVYELKFNKTESFYKEEEQLDKPEVSSGGLTITIAGDRSKLYKNTQTETFVNSRDLMGKQFLISDRMEKTDWKLENESKIIGNYTCYKATAVETYEDVEFKTGKKEVKTKNIIAWYTPEIPVTHGPDKYYGLPGLIMEMIVGKKMYLCNKLILNPEKKIEFEIPKKGKKVTQIEFDKISEKKQKEMIEKFSSGRKKGNGNTIEIKIGG
ncbi:GLPGLI family protein [Lutibacter sp. B1]|uniref:GLPGLI family protein n=1 Tax=Lutibacter sp. B1 TaxID=2725996 RepID=UPI00145765B0|nr:GLPGLI family protein [Lutibacter sp. B1]NLP58586.1 GLPGLI family protein [Lutibacter sp. B1]